MPIPKEAHKTVSKKKTDCKKHKSSSRLSKIQTAPKHSLIRLKRFQGGGR